MPKPLLSEEEKASRKAASDKRYYAANRDRLKAKQRAYYHANRERVLARQAAERAANPDKWRELDRRYTAAYRARDPGRYRVVAARCSKNYARNHPERVRAMELSWRTRNGAYVKRKRKEWEGRNREKLNAYTAKRYAARSQSKKTWLTGALITEIFDGHGGKCAYCLTGDATALDHIEPLALGGRDEEANVVPVCRSCNSSKGALTILELLRSPRRLVTQRMLAK